jgi:ABC-2 type transport system permease protein
MDLFIRIFQYRELLLELVKREIKARYKQSILGYAWVILVPLINLTVLTIVFSFLVRLPTGDVPYPIFLFVALVPWTFTSNSIATATGSLVTNSTLITKVYLPREIFPISSVLAKMVDLFLSAIILLIFLIVFGVKPHLTLFLIPVIFVIQTALIFGISFILSAIDVFFRDVESVLGVFLTVWMYLTPIIYPPELIPPKFMPIFNLNPMMPIINAYRNVIIYGVLPPWQSFIYATVFSFAIFILGYFFFKGRAKYFADVI